jgi:hypothetical protein
MSLEKEIEDILRRNAAGIPWVLGITTGVFEPSKKLSQAELLHGLQIQIGALRKSVLILAKAIDELSQDEPS